jgi:hypothetical protein
MAARAVTAAESDVLPRELAIIPPTSGILLSRSRFGVTYSTRVDRNAVILVVDFGTGNNDIVRRTDIETVRVVSALRISSGVVDGHPRNRETIAAVDAHGLDRSVLDVEIVDSRLASQAVSSEELGLGLAAVASLAVPPTGTVRVELRTAGTGDGNILALDLEQWTSPLLVAPGSGTLKDNLHRIYISSSPNHKGKPEHHGLLT